MTIGYHIEGQDGLAADVVNGEEKNALVVATRELKEHIPSSRFFTNETYGTDMNQNVAFGGTPEGVNNGGDDTWWTPSAISGSWDFTSTGQAYDGTHSIDGTASQSSTAFDLVRGASIDLTDYTTLTGYIYIEGWDFFGSNLTIQGRIGGTDLGISVNINDYVDTNNYDSWQQYQIPLVDLGLTGLTIDTFRVTNESRNNNFYLDLIQIQQTGGGLIYTVTPDLGCWCFIKKIRMTMVRGVPSTLEDNSMPAVSYDSMLGATLTNGLLFRATIEGKVHDSMLLKTFSNMLELAGVTIIENFSDGTNTMVSVEREFEKPLKLKASSRDRLEMTLQDDMTSFELFRVNVCGWLEDRSVK